MRSFTILIFTIIFSQAFAQSLSTFAGVNHGRFYSKKNNTTSNKTEYRPDYGLCIGVELGDVKIDSILTFRFALDYEEFGGYVNSKHGGTVGSTWTKADVKKQILGIEFYPINYSLFKGLNISLGFEFNVLLASKLRGETNAWSINNALTEPTDINTVSEFVAPYNWGLNTHLGYQFNIKKLFIEPRYKFHLGLTNELRGLQTSTKSFRHTLQLCIGYKFK
ncbi:MAG: hypothetical protein ACPGVI_04075 [Crocinitomicaceae bacterium]